MVFLCGILSLGKSNCCTLLFVFNHKLGHVYSAKTSLELVTCPLILLVVDQLLHPTVVAASIDIVTTGDVVYNR